MPTPTPFVVIKNHQDGWILVIKRQTRLEQRYSDIRLSFFRMTVWQPLVIRLLVVDGIWPCG